MTLCWFALTAGYFSVCEQDYGEKILGGGCKISPAINLLDVGVDLDKTNNYNDYLFRDNAVLPEFKKLLHMYKTELKSVTPVRKFCFHWQLAWLFMSTIMQKNAG